MFNTIHNVIGRTRPVSPGDATQALPNQLSGVSLFDGAHDNTIDGEISGNQAHGVYVAGLGGNTVRAHIHSNGGNGITLDGAQRNRVDARIEQNGASGVWAVNGAAGNSIRPSRVLSNAHHGVLFEGATTRNNSVDGSALVAPIAGNGFDGIATRGGAITNTWTLLLMGVNGGLPIDVNVGSDASNEQTASRPIPLGITYLGFFHDELMSAAASIDSHIGLVTGTAPAGHRVELYRYRAAPNELFGEAVGSGTTDASGIFSATIRLDSQQAVGCFAAFASTTESSIPVASGEFGEGRCFENRFRIQLPLVVR
jgi:hypothetical protein